MHLSTTRSIGRAVLGLSLVLGLAAAVPPDDWKEVQDQFTASGRQPLEPWLKLVSRLQAFDDERAAALLVQGLSGIDQSVQTLGRQYERVVQELTPLQKAQHTPTERKKYDDLNVSRKELGDQLDREQRAATAIETALGSLSGAEAQDVVLKEARRAKSWRVRVAAVTAISRWESRPADATGVLVEVLERDKEARVRVAALEAAGSLSDAALIEPVIDLLDDKYPEVLVQAAKTLGQLGSKEAVPDLIDALAKSGGNDAVAIAGALTKITGATLGEDASTWKRWWRDTSSGGGSKLPPSKGHTVKRKDVISYYGIETTSQRVLFIIDISDSMNDSALEEALPEDGSQPNREGNERSKLSVAKDELVKAMVGLSNESTFNMIFYNHTVTAWQKKMVPANKKYKNEALEIILGLKAEGATNIFEALELGFSMAGMHLADRYYPAAIDTIFFLTDGEPTAGRLTDKAAILEEISRQNRYKKVELHCIGMGILHDRNFLQSLARASGGQYVAIK